MSDFSLRRTQIIHALSIIAVVISLICSLMSNTFGIDDLTYFHAMNIFLFLLCAFIAKKGSLKSSRLLFFIFLNSSIVATASYIGQEGGVEFMLMFSLSLPFIVFSFNREKIQMFFFSIIPISLWATLFITDFNLITTSKMDVIMADTYIYPSSIISTLFLVTFLLIYYSYLNFTDLSSIHISREDAIGASNAKSEFLSTMSHEIRTPLNAVIGLSHILGSNNPRKDQIQNIEALNYSGKILLNLLNNVLDFSKMQSKAIELDNIPTDLYRVIGQIKKIHKPSCTRKGITINLEIDKGLPIVYLDVVRFNQVLNNLITNAIKFTDQGEIALKIKKRKKVNDIITLSIEVIDSGIGIPKKAQKNIWEAFTQASSTTNRLYGGTGLGLPIVKSIIEAMGSVVNIDSKKGKGSRFYFNLDLKLANEQELNNEDRKKAKNFEGKKVLLVDDNLINIMVGKQILEKSKLIVDVANDGLAAVNKVKDNNYDIILMDIQMPIMDGYTATLEIRKINKKIPILALSGAVFMEVKDKIKESGMNGFIYKPFNPEDLLNKIDEFAN
jgi:signal transduction histidine kinase/BarA-like signal transduction histidine kinase